MTEIVKAETRLTTLIAWVGKYEDRIAAVLPKHLTPERMLALSQNEIQKTPRLLECDTGSVIGSIVAASELGLEFGARQHAHLIPRRIKGRMRCQLEIGYRGLSFLAEQHPRVSATPWAYVVRKGDAFDFQLGDAPRVSHRPNMAREPDPRGEDVTAAYAVVPLKDGTKLIEVMPRWEIDKVRASSRAGDDGPWVTWYERQARKTVLKRALGLLASSGGTPQLAAALAAVDAAETGQLAPLAAEVADEIMPAPVDAPDTTGLESLTDELEAQEATPADEQKPKRSKPTEKERLAEECEEGLRLVDSEALVQIEADHLADVDGGLVVLSSLTAKKLKSLRRAINLALDAEAADAGLPDGS